MSLTRITVAVALTAAACLTVPAAQAVSNDVPTIEWKPCDTSNGNTPLKNLECGSMQAPLNYAYPEQGSITVAMARKKATNQGAKKGTLFINPGGPGGSGRQAVTGFAMELDRSVAAHWDIVGIDPRGVGGTAPFECTFDTAAPMAAPNFPWKTEQFPLMENSVAAILKGCAASTNKIAPYMTTADSARDLDRARQAVGDDKLTYYGLSYGTYLGATYTQLFPNSVRAVVLDSALDSNAWNGTPETVNVPSTSRITSRLGAQAALTNAIAKCVDVGPSICADGSALTSMYAKASERLRTGPLKVGEEEMTYPDLVWGMSSAFYSPERIAKGLDLIRTTYKAATSAGTTRSSATKTALRLSRELIAAAQAEGMPTGLPRLTPSTTRQTPDTLTRNMAFSGVLCTDGVNPKGLQAWKDHTPLVDAEVPGFGPAWLWESSLCSAWPFKGQNTYRGPFTKTTSHPVFILNNEFDPATDVAGARGLAATLPGARYMEIKGAFGHGSAFSSTCANAAVASYLNETVVPDASLVCSQSVPIFPAPNQPSKP